ncbi:MAG: hypothetical protein JW808_06205 [Victivallales bacterium]|nr:hypothetical protein [Victivallales bacterium]
MRHLAVSVEEGQFHNMRYFFIAIVYLGLFFTAGIVAEENGQGKTMVNEEGDDGLLSPDEFSKAFSKPLYKGKPRSGEGGDDPDDPELPYRKNYLGKPPFSNGGYDGKQAPPDSLAASINKLHDYFWLPRWHFIGKGEVYLPDASMSGDSSMLAIAENVPESPGSKGSMLIFINTYNWTISRVHYYPGRLLNRVFFIPNSPSVLVWEDVQKGMNIRKLHKIGISSGEIEDSSKDIPDPLGSLAMAPSGERIFLKTLNKETDLYVFDAGNLGLKPQKRDCGVDAGFLLVCPDRLAVIGQSRVIDLSIGQLQKTGETENPSGSIPDSAVCAGEGSLAIASYMGTVYLLHHGQAKLLDRMAGKGMFYKADSNTLAFEVFKNREIRFVNLSDFSEIQGVEPPRIKPPTSGAAVLLSYLEHLDRYMLLDSSGNLCLYHKPGKKWRKDLIFSAQRTVE